MPRCQLLIRLCQLSHALREQWTHEDKLVNHRLMWLILSQGLLFIAYGTLSTAKLHWLVFGFPFFGMTVAGVIGISIYAALEKWPPAPATPPPKPAGPMP